MTDPTPVIILFFIYIYRFFFSEVDGIPRFRLFFYSSGFKPKTTLNLGLKGNLDSNTSLFFS